MFVCVLNKYIHIYCDCVCVGVWVFVSFLESRIRAIPDYPLPASVSDQSKPIKKSTKNKPESQREPTRDLSGPCKENHRPLKTFESQCGNYWDCCWNSENMYGTVVDSLHIVAVF